MKGYRQQCVRRMKGDSACKQFATSNSKVTDAGSRLLLMCTVNLLAAEAEETDQDCKWDPGEWNSVKRRAKTKTYL